MSLSINVQNKLSASFFLLIDKNSLNTVKQAFACILCIAKIYKSTCLFFTFNGIFLFKNGLNFNEVHFSQSFPLWLVLFRTLCLFSNLMFISIGFNALPFTFWLMSHLKVIFFVNEKRRESSFTCL